LSFGDLTHKRTFSKLAFYNYTKNSTTSLQNSNKIKFNAKSTIRFGRVHTLLGLGYLFNKIPNIWENFLVYLFPAREIIFGLTILK
jgi:hypothetical protein